MFLIALIVLAAPPAILGTLAKVEPWFFMKSAPVLIRERNTMSTLIHECARPKINLKFCYIPLSEQ